MMSGKETEPLWRRYIEPGRPVRREPVTPEREREPEREPEREREKKVPV